MGKTISAIALGLMLAGCQQDDLATGPQGPEAPVDPETKVCQAEALQYLVCQPAHVLETMRFAPPTRIIQPGMAVTMDYLPHRLNISIGKDERIARVTCG